MKAIDADLCVIGAGAAGITIARSFLNTRTEVALVEAGGLEYDPESQAVYSGRIVGLPYPPLDVTRLRYFGGSTNHWEGQVKPFRAEDFAAQEWLPGSGWPITLRDLEPYYRRAFDLCMFGTGAYEWDPQYWLKQFNCPNPLPDEKIFRLSFYQNMVRTQPQFQSFGTYAEPSLERSKNVTLYLGLSVVELNTNAAGDRVTSVSLMSSSGTPVRLRAKVFVLATGGIENARLLLVSNSVVKAGIGNGNGLVGRYFCEHAVGHVGRLVTSGKVPLKETFEVHATASGSTFSAQLTPSPEFENEHRLTSAYVRLLPAPLPASESARSARRILDGLKSGELPDDLLHEIKTVITEIDTLIERQWYKFTHAKPDYYTLWVRVEARPRYESRVLLIDEKDRFGKQRVALDWRMGEVEDRTLDRVVKAFATEMGRMGVGRVQLVPDLVETWTEHMHVGNHHMCTTRMADNARDGVVDANCKVFSMANLYVAGSSVFSTGGSGTPTLTLVALALRLAEHLKGLRL